MKTLKNSKDAKHTIEQIINIGDHDKILFNILYNYRLLEFYGMSLQLINLINTTDDKSYENIIEKVKDLKNTSYIFGDVEVWKNEIKPEFDEKYYSKLYY